MPNNSVKIEGLAETIDSLKRGKDGSKRVTKKWMDDLGAWTTERVRDHIQQVGAIDLGELHGGMHYITTVHGNEIETSIQPSNKAGEYAIFVERGTRPHRPPIRALQGWADRHNIPVYAVVKKIEREGTEARNFMSDTFEETKHKVDIELNDLGIQVIGQF